MLDIESFTYLNRALESAISPIVVLASNRGMATIRGTDDVVAAHGVPPDFLARMLIIPTQAYEADEIKRIVKIRSNTEGVQLTDAALDKIAEHGVRISLRYCMQLLTPARCVTKDLASSLAGRSFLPIPSRSRVPFCPLFVPNPIHATPTGQPTGASRRRVRWGCHPCSVTQTH